MSELKIVEQDGALVVDSRLVAERLGIQHESFLKTVDTYQDQIEMAFGAIRFEIGSRADGNLGGKQPRYALLTEDQATLVVTFSRNTSQVVECKVELVQKFSEAKRLLEQYRVERPEPRRLHTDVYIKRLESVSEHEVADHLWTIFRESAEVLLFVEKELRVPVNQMDLCDGSIGRHWSTYRVGNSWAMNSGTYIHNFQDRRGPRECLAYEVSELPHFRRWLREIYLPDHLPSYLADKYGKKAVLQMYREIDALTPRIEQVTAEKRFSQKQENLYQQFLAARQVLALRKAS